ncbi:PLAT/LH2 domain-containing protein [Streptomyces platensis]|uniref:PLAT/LH2 domain-containing protein n=1 Tax=Streptomyces platensis TaxID=58346 RepID=UPI003787AD33
MRIGRVVAGTMALATATIMATSESAAASVTPRIGSDHTYSGRQNTPSNPLDKGIGVAAHRQYRVAVYTGKREDAGTDANVYLTIYGTRGSVGHKLDNSEDNFERGKTDRFTLGLRDVGRVTSITISHNNKGDKPGWYLKKVTIGGNANFPAYRWLAKDEDDNRTWAHLRRR